MVASKHSSAVERELCGGALMVSTVWVLQQRERERKKQKKGRKEGRAERKTEERKEKGKEEEEDSWPERREHENDGTE